MQCVYRCRWCCVLVRIAVAVRRCNRLKGVAGVVYLIGNAGAFLSVAVARCCSLVDRCRWCCVLVSVGVALRWCNVLIGVVGSVYW